MKLEDLLPSASVQDSVEGIVSSTDIISMHDIVVSDVLDIIDLDIFGQVLIVHSLMNFSCVHSIGSSGA